MLQRLVMYKRGEPLQFSFPENFVSEPSFPDLVSNLLNEIRLRCMVKMNASVMCLGTTSVFALYHNALSQVNKIRSSRQGFSSSDRNEFIRLVFPRHILQKDHARIKKNHAPESMAFIRLMALSALKQLSIPKKTSVKWMRKICAYDMNLLGEVMNFILL